MPVHNPAGVKIHWTGARYDSRPHDECEAYLRGIQAFHMDARGWADIGYSLMCCQHGAVFVGRGPGHRNAANGNEELNAAHYAVLGMVGNSGLITPPAAMLDALVDAITYLRAAGGAGEEVKRHADGYPTECPGPALSAWVQAGALRPGSLGADLAFPGIAAFDDTVLSLASLVAQCALNRAGFPVRLSAIWDAASISACAAFQRAQGWTGASADGMPGPATWALLTQGLSFEDWMRCA